MAVDNTERFTDRVDVYERYRMRYPAAEIIATLTDWCALTPAQTIADIGSGTGMLSEVFLEHGNPVIAVEPNAEMRSACAPLAHRFSNLSIVAAAAENTTLPDASIDLVTAGRAFHWFEQDRALAEFRRILRPGGWLVLLSASRDKHATPANREAEDLLLACSPDREHGGGGHRLHENFSDLFPNGSNVLQKKLHGEERLTREAFIGQTLSYSSAPAPHTLTYVPFIDALQAIFDRYAEDGLLRVPTVCWISCVRLSN